MTDLQKRAEELAGRSVEVEKLPGGKYIVMYMDFNSPPPQPGDTEEEALQNFITLKAASKDSSMVHDTDDTNTGDSDADNLRSSGEHDPENPGPSSFDGSE